MLMMARAQTIEQSAVVLGALVAVMLLMAVSLLGAIVLMRMLGARLEATISRLLGMILANLIGNATRYGGPTTRILLRASASPEAIVLSVADDGPGIAPEMLPPVFEKFVRAPRRGGDAGEGSGIGLAIVKGIVDAHHGSIAAISPAANGRGARFELRLPLAEEPR